MNFSKYFQVLVWVLLVATCQIDCESEVADFLDELQTEEQLAQLKSEKLNSSTFSEIENDVSKRVSKEHTDNEISALIRRMTEEEEESQFRLAQREPTEPSKAARLEALETLSSLVDTRLDCDHESYTIMAKNYLLAGMEREYPPGNTNHPLVQLISRSSDKLGTACIPKYQGMFESRFATASKLYSLRRVDRLFDEQFMNELAGGGGGELIFTKSIYKFDLGGTRLAKRLKDKVLAIAGRRDARNGPLDRALFESFVVAPCKEFINRMEGVFAPARFLLMVKGLSPRDDRLNASEEFLKRWKQYRSCMAYLMTDQTKFTTS